MTPFIITLVICLFCIAIILQLAYGSPRGEVVNGRHRPFPAPSPNFKSQISNFKSKAILVLVLTITAFAAFVIGSSVALYLRWLFRQLF